MPKGKKRRTESEKSRGKQRRKSNQIAKYNKLIKMFPESKDILVWQKKIESL